MAGYTNNEMADMHFVYGAADGNASQAQMLYKDRFPIRRTPDRKTFERLHRRLCESGSFAAAKQDAGRKRSIRTPQLAEDIMCKVEDQPRCSTRAVTLHEEIMHPYRTQKIQALSPADYQSRLDFARWYLHQNAAQPDFGGHVLFTDQCTFTRQGVFNTHNSHTWASTNLHATRPHSFQRRFSVNVWAGILHDHLVGPYLLPNRLDGESHDTFQREVLPELLDPIPTPIRSRMWFQHDGAPAHFSLDVRNILDLTFPGRWIGRCGPIAWPPRSWDLSCLYFFLWGHMKSLMFECPIETEMDLVARIAVVAGNIREMPGVFANVRQSLSRRGEASLQLADDLLSNFFEYVH